MHIADIKALTPEQLRVHLETGRLNARGRHQSKRVYSRKDQNWKRGF